MESKIKVFVSYSWDNEEHEVNVFSFVNYLRNPLGFEATHDKMEMQKETATHFGEMMARNIPVMDKVILVLSDGYKRKTDDFKAGVGTEFRYIINDIETNPKKYILGTFLPINKDNLNLILPEWLKGREVVHLTDIDKLIGKLKNEPVYDIPDVASDIAVVNKKNIPNFEEIIAKQLSIKKTTQGIVEEGTETILLCGRIINLFDTIENYSGQDINQNTCNEIAKMVVYALKTTSSSQDIMGNLLQVSSAIKSQYHNSIYLIPKSSFLFDRSGEDIPVKLNDLLNKGQQEYIIDRIGKVLYEKLNTSKGNGFYSKY